MCVRVRSSKEIPPRPKEFEGALALYGLAKEANEKSIRSAFTRFGTVVSVRVGGWPPAVLRFSTHEAALAALNEGPLVAVCGGLSHLYKDLPYDQKGWCAAIASLPHSTRA